MCAIIDRKVGEVMTAKKPIKKVSKKKAGTHLETKITSPKQTKKMTGKKKNKKIVSNKKSSSNVKKRAIPISKKGVISKKKKLKKERKKVKIRYTRVLFLFIIVCFVLQLGIWLWNLPITNLYVKGNTILSDQEIIELAHLQNYPSFLQNSAKKIKKRLEKNRMIKSAKVTRRGFRGIQIIVVENRPLFYNMSNKKTILLDHTEVDTIYAIPTLKNYVPDTIYESFIEQFGKIDDAVLKRISEIKYQPNEVDKERFLLTMSDGNLVYLTLPKFSNINNYIDIIRKFEGKKGILYLDYGTRFEIKAG